MKFIPWLLIIPLATLIAQTPDNHTYSEKHKLTACATDSPRNPLVVTPPPQPRPETPPVDTELQKKQTLKALEQIHEKFETEFAITPGNGMSRVVEIQRHYLRDKSLFTFVIGKDTWKIEMLDLIGMLQAKPNVRSTPVLTDANKTKKEILRLARLAKPREADDFETAVIGTVNRTGKTIARLGPDEIRMVGALHATADCLLCHSQKADFLGKHAALAKGDVLGAFTYRLTRVKPDVVYVK